MCLASLARIVQGDRVGVYYHPEACNSLLPSHRTPPSPSSREGGGRVRRHVPPGVEWYCIFFLSLLNKPTVPENGTHHTVTAAVENWSTTYQYKASRKYIERVCVRATHINTSHSQRGECERFAP